MGNHAYITTQGAHGVFVEIYFPKRAAYQGAIYDALRYGVSEEYVKRYLKKNQTAILRSTERYLGSRTSDIRPEQAILTDIAAYKSRFAGWSVYSVDGVFANPRTKGLIEESTQVVRIMFRYNSKSEATARRADCSDVLRAIFVWTISRPTALYDECPWAPKQRRLFVKAHEHWPKNKLAFARRHFEQIATEAARWRSDCGLFVFGYLVRTFSDNLLSQGLREDEIWVTAFWNLSLYIIKRRRRRTAHTK